MFSPDRSQATPKPWLVIYEEDINTIKALELLAEAVPATIKSMDNYELNKLLRQISSILSCVKATDA